MSSMDSCTNDTIDLLLKTKILFAETVIGYYNM